MLPDEDKPPSWFIMLSLQMPSHLHRLKRYIKAVEAVQSFVRSDPLECFASDDNHVAHIQDTHPSLFTFVLFSSIVPELFGSSKLIDKLKSLASIKLTLGQLHQPQFNILKTPQTTTAQDVTSTCSLRRPGKPLSY